jgi:hypothetical protein
MTEIGPWIAQVHRSQANQNSMTGQRQIMLITTRVDLLVLLSPFVGLKAVNHVSAVAMCFSFVARSLSKVKDGQLIRATHASLKMKNGSDHVEARPKS